MRFVTQWAGTAALGLGLLLVAGCAANPRPFDYQPDHELKPGPGLFSGEDGVFTLMGPPALPQAKDLPAAGGTEAPADVP